jgi:PAS domain S-box-containing protein
MRANSPPFHEAERLRALQAYGVLDTPPEAAFDELVALAARICGTPMSVVSLIDRDRQWFKARHGITRIEAPRDVLFCAHAINRPDELLIVADAMRDARFSGSPFVMEVPDGRFYAAVPLCTPEGHAVGTLCVIDRHPRTLGADQQEGLRVLGRQVMAQLELRRRMNDASLNSVRLENSQRIAGLGDWEHDFVHDRLVWSEEFYRILGLKREDGPPEAAAFDRRVHPDDLAVVRREKSAAAEDFRRVDFEHRIIRPDGEVRYIYHIAEMIFDDQGGPVWESGTIQDITDRKLAAEAFRQSEHRYRLMFERNPSPMWVFDPKTLDFLAVNDATAALYGYTREEFLKLTVLDIRPPDTVPALMQRVAAAQSEFRDGGRFLHRKKDGTVFPVELLAHPIDFADRPARLVLAVDLTEAERAAAALQISESRFHTLSESAPLGIFESDAAGKVVYSNPALAALSGRPGLDRLDQAWEESIHPDDRAAMSAGWKLAATEGRVWDQVQRLLRPDGSVRWVHTYAMPNRDPEGRVTGFVGTVEDITQRRANDVSEVASEERYRKLLQLSPDAHFLHFDSLITLVNRAFCELPAHAVKPAPTSSRPPHALPEAVAPEIVLPDVSPAGEDASAPSADLEVVAAEDAGAESWSAEIRFQRPDGSHALVQDRGFIIRDAEGKSVRMVGGMRDLTEQRKLETQYLRAQRMESIGTLAFGIAHDLNNVLAPILMSIELLKQDAGIAAGRRNILDIIHVSCRRGADLVHQVLSFARGLDGQRIVIRLLNLITDLGRIISETFPRNIRIVTEVPIDLWPITGDPTQLHQVLLNLAVNARDAMPAGGTLTLAASNVTIDALYAGMSPDAKIGAHVCLRVSDTGLGMSPEIRERIFEPFFTTKALGKGTGLGLATVHAIVKSHGGFLSVESEVGQGTTFKIYLEANPALPAIDTPHPFAEDLPRGRGELVLVVDDEFSILNITQQTLEAFGYRVLTAFDGAEAVALYAQQPQDIALVVTDMMMPIMDGATTIQVLTRINPAVRIIAASGLDAAENVAKATSAGAKNFLAKPYTAQSLIQMIRDVIDRPTPPVVH